MPIVSVERIGADVQMGVWRMEDTQKRWSQRIPSWSPSSIWPQPIVPQPVA